jgi:hypothetical protein
LSELMNKRDDGGAQKGIATVRATRTDESS